VSATDPNPPPTGSPFWRFSLRLYRQPGVAEACIALQEQAEVDVNLLLFLLWQASEGRCYGVGDVAALERRISGWRNIAVIPLRALRRALKSPPDLLAAGVAEGFRSRIKAVELEAERLQQEAMYDLARSAPAGTAATAPGPAARDNVAAYQQICPTPFPAAPLAAILGAFIDQAGRARRQP
jgi:uncharacterized protein (TIGR02444 family)